MHTGEDPGAGVLPTGAPVLLYFGPMLSECLEQVTLSPHASVSPAVNGYRLMYRLDHTTAQSQSSYGVAPRTMEERYRSGRISCHSLRPPLREI